jgi:hypothetical protein
MCGAAAGGGLQGWARQQHGAPKIDVAVLVAPAKTLGAGGAFLVFITSKGGGMPPFMLLGSVHSGAPGANIPSSSAMVGSARGVEGTLSSALTPPREVALPRGVALARGLALPRGVAPARGVEGTLSSASSSAACRLISGTSKFHELTPLTYSCGARVRRGVG